eukprot:scaffold7970_cov118-Cylindrotheca_fusiformis.AAC.9
MTQPQQLRQYPRSRSATRAPRSASISSDRTSSATKSHQTLMSAHPSPLILRATSMDREIYPSRKRSSSVQRYRPSSNVPQHQQTQQLSSVTGIANIQRSSSATENGSVISAPSVFSHYNREFREPMSSKHVAKKMTREQSPANSRKSPTEKSQRTTRATRKLIEGKNSCSVDASRYKSRLNFNLTILRSRVAQSLGITWTRTPHRFNNKRMRRI